ncbi:hypothetical protein [Planctobacterium marinum]
MKKLIWIGLTVAAFALGGCSSTSDVAKAEKEETKKTSSTSKRRSGDCVGGTGSRLGSRCK